MENTLRYVLITPARNEAAFIEQTIESVVAQTVRPVKWVIVSHGSTDGTDEIATQYTANTPWLELIRMPERRERDSAGKVRAFNVGYTRMAGLKYDVIGSLDADISFEPDYFSLLLEKLSSDPGLGVVGTPFQETSGQVYDYRFVSVEHVSGACQVFRRECFEQIGGYLPVKGGSIDHIAVITTRMKNSDIYREDLPTPSSNGNRGAELAEVTVQTRDERLLNRQSPDAGVRQDRSSNDTSTCFNWRAGSCCRVSLGSRPSSSASSIAQAGCLPRTRANATPKPVYPP